MRIKEMTATFGKLERASLKPGPGLTVITAPNEGGKSTWAAFLRAMFYGVPTSERDKAGKLAEKNRFAPWSGAPMEGEIKLEWQGRDVILRRSGNQAGPFSGFAAVYADSGDPVPGLDGENAGELLLGAGREVYERSGFLGQGSAVIGASDELESRIASLVSAGEEVSPSQVRRQLKEWANRRRSNRSNGLIPELEEELGQIESRLETLSEARRAQAAAMAERNGLEEEAARLEEELEIHRDVERRELDLQYARACRELERAKAMVPVVETDPVFGGLTAEEAWEQAEDDADWVDQLEQPEPFPWLGVICAVPAAVSILLLALGGILKMPWITALAVLPLLGLGAFLVWKFLERRKHKAKREVQIIRILQQYGVENSGELMDRAAEYRERLASAQQAKEAVAGAQAIVDMLAAQGAKEPDGSEVPPPPPRSKLETAEELEQASGELERAKDKLAQARGALSTLGDPDQLESRREALLEEQTARIQELEALEIAMEALDRAEESMRQRFSPALNKRTGEFFGHMTGGSYRAVSLSRTFEAEAQERDGVLPRKGLYLSDGTLDQLYLAARLAVCELVLSGPEPAPLVLDDALANFDGKRAAAALELLRELGKERQIMLFTCHQRESDWAQRHGVPVLSLNS